VTLSVPLTEIIKSTIPFVILLYHYAVGKEEPSVKQAFVMLLIVVGVSMTSMGDLSWRISGFIMALCAVATACCKLVLMENMLTGKDRLSPLTGLFYLAPITFLSLIGPFFIFEYEKIERSGFFEPGKAQHTASLVLGAGFLVFFLNISSMYVISFTSAITLCVTAILRLIFIIIFNAFFFPDFTLQPVNEIGITVTMLGVSLYNYYRLKDMGIVGGENERGPGFIDPDDEASPLVLKSHVSGDFDEEDEENDDFLVDEAYGCSADFGEYDDENTQNESTSLLSPG